MATIKIKLLLDAAGNLSVPEEVRVDHEDRLIWERNHPRIEWFSIAGKKTGQAHPFHHLNSNPRFRLAVRVLNNIPYNYTWKYLIKYKLDTEDEPRILDPKIAVKPRKNFELSMIMSLGLAAITFAGIRYFRKMKSTGKFLNNR